MAQGTAASYPTGIDQPHRAREEQLRQLTAIMPEDVEAQLTLIHQHTLSMFRNQENIACDEIRSLRLKIDESTKQITAHQKRQTQLDAENMKLKSQNNGLREDLKAARDQIVRLQTKNSILEKVRMAVLSSVQDPDVVSDEDFCISAHRVDVLSDPMTEPVGAGSAIRSLGAMSHSVEKEASTLLQEARERLKLEQWQYVVDLVKSVTNRKLSKSHAQDRLHDELHGSCPADLLTRLSVMFSQFNDSATERA